MTIDASGDIFVATAHGKQIGQNSFMAKIRRYNSEGHMLGAFDVSYGHHFPRPGVNIQGMVAHDNKLYYTIADFGELRILDLHTGREEIFGGLGERSMDLALDRVNEVLYVVDTFPLRLRRFNIATRTYGEPILVPDVRKNRRCCNRRSRNSLSQR